MNATIPRLTLDENHIYRLDGQLIPGVTEILKDVGLLNHWNRDEWYMERGTAVHLAVQYWLEGDLNEDLLDPRIKPYLDAFKEAKGMLGLEVLANEEMVFSEARWYAGTMDLLVKYEDAEEVWDIKTGTKMDADGYQTAAYAGAKFGTSARYYKRRGLYLKGDGSFKPKRDLIQHDNPDDLNTFYSAVNIYHAKRR